MFRIVSLFAGLITFAQPSFAVTVNGEYPVCKTSEGLHVFIEAKIFENYEKTQSLVEND